MKKVLALLLSCLLITAIAAPVTAFAAVGDDFVGSVEQNSPIDHVPEQGDGAPQTGEAIPLIPIIGAVLFAGVAVALFVIAGKKRKK